MHERARLGLPSVAVGCGIVWRAPAPVTQRDNRVLTTHVGKSGHAGDLPVRHRQVGIGLGSVLREGGCAGAYGYREFGWRDDRCAVSAVQVYVADRENDGDPARSA